MSIERTRPNADQADRLIQTQQQIRDRMTEIRDILQKGSPGIVYGFHIASDESDPDERVTYVAGAVGATPAYMDFTAGVFVWGSWRDAFFLPKPCMLKYDGTVDYYLDQNDYTKKANGEASDVADLAYGGNAMMEWGQGGRKIWYKIVPDADPTGATVYIADYQVDSGYKDWAFRDKNGNQIDHFYTPIYNGHLDSSNRMRSMSGQAYTKSLTATKEREYCRNNGADIWDTEVYCDIILINLLLTLMCKSTSTQAKFGTGLTDSGSQAINEGFTTGVHNDKGLFYGTNSGAAATYTNAVKIFGMENWWGFAWRRFGGLINDNGTMRYKMTRSKADGSDVDDYVVSTSAEAYTGYLEGNALPTASGSYISKETFDSNQCCPSEASGSASAYYCDGLWTNNNQVDYAYRGGGSNRGARCGAWCLLLNGTASAASWDIAAAPSCKPLS